MVLCGDILIYFKLLISKAFHPGRLPIDPFAPFLQLQASQFCRSRSFPPLCPIAFPVLRFYFSERGPIFSESVSLLYQKQCFLSHQHAARRMFVYSSDFEFFNPGDEVKTPRWALSTALSTRMEYRVTLSSSLSFGWREEESMALFNPVLRFTQGRTTWIASRNFHCSVFRFLLWCFEKKYCTGIYMEWIA